MSRILTFSHNLIDPLKPETELVDIVDIAHALSMLCRANGHFPTFYSVGQHCINCAREARARGYTKRVQLACLLHDASEAYLSDVTRPIKKELPKYKEIEEPLQDFIWRKYLGQPLTIDENRQVFEIDDDVLAHEFISLMKWPLSENVPAMGAEMVFEFTGFEVCQKEFLELFDTLITQIG